MSILQLYMNSLCIYKDIMNDSVIHNLKELVDYISVNEKLNLNNCLSLYNNFVYGLLRVDKNLDFNSYTLSKVLFNDNLISKYIERNEEINDDVLERAKTEIDILNEIGKVSAAKIKETIIKKSECSNIEEDIIRNLLEWSSKAIGEYDFKNDEINSLYKDILTSNRWSDRLENIIKVYKQYGTGEFALYKAFVWENGDLRKIEQPDPIKLKELIGYEYQKETIINNTLQFLKGNPANNLLLYGSRGTGKSSTVKALINEYYDKGLRLIQVDKEDLVDFPSIINKLRNKNHKFIIFVDDLVFQENEPAYSALKTILEGKVENRPDNIVIYATTNRRHLVKETFSDRAGMGAGDSNEIHPKDTMEEKLSLADRFGITVTFISPNQKEFLNIVDGIVKNRNISIDEEYLHREALKWERSHNGRSPRTATQFIDWLQGQIS